MPIGRKKRSADEEENMLGFMKMLANGMDQHDVQDKLMASYVTCADDSDSATLPCLQQLACRYEDVRTASRLKPVERDAAAVILGSLMRNKHLSETVKASIRKAGYIGRGSPYMCDKLYQCGQDQAKQNSPKLF